jgi:hypothetical protein
MKAGASIAAHPDEYVAALTGWRRSLVEKLRAEVMAVTPLDERIKWTHLVYFANGPALFIRAEDSRVLFGFWRGTRLRAIEPRLKPGGKYEMATVALRQGDTIAPRTVDALVREAVRLNGELGDPTR